jgi:UPF0716 protein FxsA
MRFLAICALIAIAEMATFLWLGSQIGFGWALAIAVTTALIGSFLVRRSGLAVWRRFRDKVDHGRLPGREISDGAATLVAGAFLISPGLITDTLGFLLLLPPVRDLLYRKVSKRLTGRVSVYTSGWQATPGQVYDGEIIDVDEVEDADRHQLNG